VAVEPVAVPLPVISGLSLAASQINEGGTAKLVGEITNPAVLAAQTVTIDWGDGSTPTTAPVTVLNGVGLFSSTHVYQNNPPLQPGQSSGPYPITVTATNTAQQSISSSVSEIVANVPPTVTALNVSPTSVTFGSPVTLTGSFTDPGVLDTHTVSINWGDGTPATLAKVTEANGSGSFTATHTYVINPAGQVSGAFTITATATDSDGGQGSATTGLTVQGLVALPVISGLSLASSQINTGVAAKLVGDITNPSVLKAQTVTINWGDGSAPGSVPVSVLGSKGLFSATHVYATAGAYTITVTATNSAQQSISSTIKQTVVNIPQVVFSGLSLASSHISVGGTARLVGSIANPTVLGAGLVTINWGDGSAATVASVNALNGLFAATHTYTTSSTNQPNGAFAIIVTATNSAGVTTRQTIYETVASGTMISAIVWDNRDEAPIRSIQTDDIRITTYAELPVTEPDLPPALMFDELTGGFDDAADDEPAAPLGFVELDDQWLLLPPRRGPGAAHERP
jgi:hypothetical protein